MTGVFEKAYSNLYDFIYQDKDYAGEAVFIQNLLVECGVAQGNLLDFGCGTGRHAIEFAQLGWKVAGVDSSAEMLKLAEQRKHSTGVDIFLSHSPQGVFDVAVSLFSVLNYLEPERELPGALATIRGAMRGGAVAVFEVWNGVAVPFLSEARKSKRLMGPEGEEVLRTTDTQINWLNQWVDIQFQLYRPPHEEEWFSETHRMHYQTPQQFISHLGKAGFSNIRILPAFLSATVGRDTFSVLYVCEVAANA